MKRILTLCLAAVLLVAAVTGCSKQEPAQLTPEERTALYETSIKNARDQEANDVYAIITSPDATFADTILPMLGVTAGDMTAYAVSASIMNTQAYGIAAIYPASGKEDTVLEGLGAFVDQQKQNFNQYLMDQYDIASNARLETLEDGTILLVMCEGQDAVFESIKDGIEAGK